jgi:uncharacterized protein (DUF433 family)
MSADSPVFHSDPDILGGTPVFVGTRVPVRTLFDYLEAGETLHDFLDDFPSVSCEQAVTALRFAEQLLVTHGGKRRTQKERRRFPLNAPGDFYVEDDMCMACAAPEPEAPDLMGHTSGPAVGYHCYFKRQPENGGELAQAIMAVAVGCCGAVRYGGSDPYVIAELVKMGVGDACDCHG